MEVLFPAREAHWLPVHGPLAQRERWRSRVAIPDGSADEGQKIQASAARHVAPLPLAVLLQAALLQAV
jgi:hypothetical protein